MEGLPVRVAIRFEIKAVMNRLEFGGTFSYVCKDKQAGPRSLN